MVRRVVAGLVLAAALAVAWLLASDTRSTEPAAEPEAITDAPQLERDATQSLRSDAPAAEARGEPPPRQEDAEPSSTEAPSAVLARPLVTVRVRVLTDDLPAPGVDVELLDVVPAAGESVDEWRLAGATDFAGVVELRSPFSPKMSVLASEPGGGRALKSLEREKGDRQIEVRVRFGSARVEGRVWSLQGQEASGAIVQLDCVAAHWKWRVSADATGAFAFESVPDGDVIVSTFSAPMKGAPGHSTRIETRARETLHVELGSPRPLSTWKGRLRAPSGAELEFPVPLWTAERARGWKALFNADSQGRFERELAAGEYGVFTESGRGQLQLGSLSIGAGERLEQDVVVPAPFALVECRWASDEKPAKGRQVTLTSEETGATRVRFSTDSARMLWFGLEPGAWRVNVTNSRIEGALDGGVTLHLAPDSEIELVLRLLR